MATSYQQDDGSPLETSEEACQRTMKIEFPFTSQVARYLWEKCTKHPGHTMFIPINKFTKHHLPEKYRTDNVFESIKLTSDLTVRVTVGYTSDKRPKGDSFYSMRGKKSLRFGSGIVFSIKPVQSGDLCPCRDCVQSTQKRTVVAKIHVKTANHVVFDSSEAKAAVVDLFYDDGDSTKSEEGVKSLFGFKVIKSSAAEDWCKFMCLTHDKELVGTLSDKLQALEVVNNQSVKEVSKSAGEFAIIASHPHGYFKHITVGEVRLIEKWGPMLDHISFEENRVIFYLYSSGSGGSSGPAVADKMKKMAIEKETQPAGIEVAVLYPDLTSEKCLIWQFDQPVEETKKFLLEHGGIHEPPGTLKMVMDLPNEERQVMDDVKDINYYWDDLTRALQIRFENNDNGG